MDHSIPLNQDQKSFLSNGIFRAITQDLPELIYENELPTKVGSGLFRWNFINRNLSSELGGDFELSFQKRGAWKFLLLRDRATNLSFSIMSEQNLKRLQHSPPLQPHYIEALVSDNENREPIEGQTCIEGIFEDRDATLLSELKNQLLSGFTDIIKEHVLILFDYNFSGVTSVRAVLLTPKLEVAVSDDWTSYMKSPYIPRHSLLSDLASDSEDTLVKLKGDYDTSNLPIVENPSNNQDNEKK